VVARLGGDEFVVLAHKLDSVSVELLKARLERAVHGQNLVPGRDYELSFSLGFSTFDPALPVSIETLLAQADSRMHEAKAARRRKLKDATAPSSVGSPRAGRYPELLRKTPAAGSS
jgi:diguanylate cyclase (GGDEF)-like protein